jgi:basic membrane protein A
MFKKISYIFSILLIASLLLVACAPAEEAVEEVVEEVEEVVEEVEEVVEAEPFEACMVTDSAGIGDKSFNDAVWKGLQQAETDFGITANYIESKTADDYAPNLQACVDSEPDMIVCVGFMMADACEASVTANPDIYYISIDIDWITYPNLLGVGAYMDQSSFLAGYVSAGMTQTDKLAVYTGFFGPVVQIFLDGFWMGMTKYNEDNGTSVEVLGYDPANMEETAAIGSWIDVDAGRTLSETFLDNGADIFYPVCGNVGAGTAAAIVDRETANPDFKGFIFGMDQDWLETNPQYAPQILGSAMKKMDVPVYQSIKSLIETGEWIGGEAFILTLENGGTEIVWNSDAGIPADLLDQANAYIAKIISGEQPSLSPEFLALYPR